MSAYTVYVTPAAWREITGLPGYPLPRVADPAAGYRRGSHATGTLALTGAGSVPLPRGQTIAQGRVAELAVHTSQHCW